jgi:hypothetical protein
MRWDGWKLLISKFKWALVGQKFQLLSTFWEPYMPLTSSPRLAREGR